MRKWLRNVWACLLLTVLFASLSGRIAYAADDGISQSGHVVKVAYPIQTNLTETDEYGQYFGYSADYLNAIAEFAGWKLSFVTYPGLTDNEQMVKALEDVQSGEADLLGGMLYTAALKDTCLYSANSYGVVYTTLETLDSNHVNETNYKQCDPLRVAVLENANSRIAELDAFAANSGLKIKYVLCSTAEQQLECIKSGDADALVNVSLSFIPNMKTLAKFSSRPFYFISGLGNEDLLKELDAAIESIDRTDPYLKSRLQAKYFSSTLTNFTLSPDESSFVNSCGTIRVLVCPHYAPFSFKNNDGKLCGIGISILDEIAKASGLQFEYILSDEAADFTEQAASGQYDLIVGPPKSSDYAQSNRLVTSQEYLQMDMAVFVNQSAQGTPQSDRVLAVNAEFPSAVAQSFKELKYYDDIESCMDAVESGDADFGYANRFTVDFFQFGQRLSFAEHRIALRLQPCHGVLFPA